MCRFSCCKLDRLKRSSFRTDFRTKKLRIERSSRRRSRRSFLRSGFTAPFWLNFLSKTEHCPAAVWSSTTAARFVSRFVGNRVVDFELIIVKKLLTRADVTQGIDKHTAASGLDRLAIRVAGMVDPTSLVPAHPGIDHISAVIDSKQEGVAVFGIVGHARPGHAFSGVLYNTRGFSNRLGGKNTAAMDGGFSNDQRGSRRPDRGRA